MGTLILVTSEYPYGTGETFIAYELPYLAAAFSHVYLFAAQVPAGTELPMRAVPEGVRVFPGFGKTVTRRSYLKSLTSPPVWREITRRCLGKGGLGKLGACCFFDRTVASSLSRLPRFLELVRRDANGDELVVYSYWLTTAGMTALGIARALRREGHAVRTAARAHGYDLYRERAYLGYQPFQHDLIEGFDAIYPCSENGSNYLQENYPAARNKIRCAYLGVPDGFRGCFPAREPGKLRIVSCSNVIPLKRVDRIVEALEQIDGVSVEWTHFGDGEELERIKQAAATLPPNIVTHFPGRVPGREILEHYRWGRADLFVNVSASEGLPVSIMEACSFGIPVIATDVGGTGEIVSSGGNGLLLKPDFDPGELAAGILSFAAMPQQDYERLCRRARAIYEETFCAGKNYPAFCEKLIRRGEWSDGQPS